MEDHAALIHVLKGKSYKLMELAKTVLITKELRVTKAKNVVQMIANLDRNYSRMELVKTVQNSKENMVMVSSVVDMNILPNKKF